MDADTPLDNTGRFGYAQCLNIRIPPTSGVPMSTVCDTSMAGGITVDLGRTPGGPTRRRMLTERAKMPILSEIRDAYQNNIPVQIVTMYNTFVGYIIRYDTKMVDLKHQSGSVMIPIDMIEELS